MFNINNKEELFNEFSSKFTENLELITQSNISDIEETINNHNFAIMFTKREVFIWANNGLTSILSFKYNYEEGFTFEVFEKMYKAIENFLNGNIHCCGCHKLIKIVDIAGKYFAGSYCKDCWEREWREKEAQENYE